MATNVVCSRCEGTGTLYREIVIDDELREESIDCPDCYGTGKRQSIETVAVRRVSDAD